MRTLTTDEVAETIQRHEEYMSSLQPNVGTIDKQKLFIAKKESKGLLCPLCTGPTPPFIARAAYYATDTGTFDPMPKCSENLIEPATDYTCSLCGTQLRYVIEAFAAGVELWTLVHPTVVERHLRKLCDGLIEGPVHAVDALDTAQLLDTLQAIRKRCAEKDEEVKAAKT